MTRTKIHGIDIEVHASGGDDGSYCALQWRGYSCSLAAAEYHGGIMDENGDIVLHIKEHVLDTIAEFATKHGY